MAKKGFTIFELLVVLAIIGTLAAIVLVNIANARSRARDARRASDIKEISNVIGIYHASNGSYPSSGSCSYTSGTPNIWAGPAAGCTGSNWIPGIVPAYMSELPDDPGPTTVTSMNGLLPPGTVPGNNDRGYLYWSNGVDYKIMAHIPENCSESTYKTLVDPTRVCWAWSIYSSGAINR
ncbi:MAG: Type II secretion system protein G precursor [bacterium ADurb.Bin400]|nr:MAG: Type II secretion system protein G precursor [bacterium ADurb.Bin400]